MEEDEGLLPQDDEYSITKLRQFRENKHPCPEARYTVLFNETATYRQGEKMRTGLANYTEINS